MSQQRRGIQAEVLPASSAIGVCIENMRLSIGARSTHLQLGCVVGWRGIEHVNLQRRLVITQSSQVVGTMGVLAKQSPVRFTDQETLSLLLKFSNSSLVLESRARTEASTSQGWLKSPRFFCFVFHNSIDAGQSLKEDCIGVHVASRSGGVVQTVPQVAIVGIFVCI